MPVIPTAIPLDRLPLRGIEGIIRLRRVPNDVTPADFADWWPRVSEREKAARYAEPFYAPTYDRHGDYTGEWEETDETRNLLTNQGIQSVLQLFCYSNQTQLEPYQQIMSLGNGALTGVQRTDTAVAGDNFASGSRKVPTSYGIIGFQGTHSTLYGTGDANGTLTNGGWYGYNFQSNTDATTSGGTGWLNTHFMFSYVKTSSISFVLDYINVLSN